MTHTLGSPQNITRKFSDRSIEYPAPFFDIAQTYYPPTTKPILKWCRYYYNMDPICGSIIYKMAEYPVTPILWGTENQEKKNMLRKVFEGGLKLNSKNIEFGLNYFTYGNVFVSLNYPFQRYLKCTTCKNQSPIKKVAYKFRNYEFRGICKKCNENNALFEVIDVNIKNYKEIRVVVWEPENIDIDHNPITGDSVYYYSIPNRIKTSIIAGNHIIETIPSVFIQAVKENKKLVMEKTNFYHLKRPTIAEPDQGWGKPLLMPVLKHLFYLQVLRKAQESIALERINPFTFLFPQQNGSLDPYQHMNLEKWKREVEGHINKWRQDPNHKPIMPIAVGHGNIGGDARALLVTPEIEAVTRVIAGGLGVPLEFLIGGLSWTGSSISLRMLENHFLTFREDLLDLDRFIVNNVLRFMGLETVDFEFQQFKMADDVSQKEFVAAQAASGKISDETILSIMGLDAEKERRIMLNEIKKKAEVLKKEQEERVKIEAYLEIVKMQYKMKAEQELRKKYPGMNIMPDESAPGDPTSDTGEESLIQEEEGQQPQQEVTPENIENTTSGYMNKMKNMTPEEKDVFLAEIEKQNPSLAYNIRKTMSRIDTKDLPEIKPPRRENAVV